MLKLAQQRYYIVLPLISNILSWKMSALVWSDILSLFVNTFTADNKYFRCNVQNFEEQVQGQLFQKVKSFSWLFIAFLKGALNSEQVEKRDEYPSLIISQIIDSERGG